MCASKTWLSRYQQFWRTYDSTWRPVLKFLAPTTHGTCDDCCEYKDLFRTTLVPWQTLSALSFSCLPSDVGLPSAYKVRDQQARFDVARAYKEHLNQIAEDRSLESFLQAHSTA